MSVVHLEDKQSHVYRWYEDTWKMEKKDQETFQRMLRIYS